MFTLGVVPYLNAVPLTATLDGDVRLHVDVPSRLRAPLQDGRVDAALLPVFEALQGVGDGFLGRYGIASRGAVRSVLLFLRTPLEAVRTLCLDPASRTSGALARYLVEQVTRAPVTVSMADAPGSDPRRADADAVLLIGDPARRAAATWPGATVDLGALWEERTGLPLVYARWTARQGLTREERARLAALLDRAGDEGVSTREAHARSWARALGEDEAEAACYVRGHVHYTIGPEEEAGLAHYAAVVAAHRDASVGETRRA